jgi:hypothetical protein
MIVDDDKIKTELEFFLGREPTSREITFVSHALRYGNCFIEVMVDSIYEAEVLINLCETFKTGKK